MGITGFFIQFHFHKSICTFLNMNSEYIFHLKLPYNETYFTKLKHQRLKTTQ